MNLQMFGIRQGHVRQGETQGHFKGFTLIELLVVIAIIGILATVVLASLSTARSKANDASIKSSLDSIRSAAEVQYDTLGNSYNTGTAITSNVCSTLSTANSILADTGIQNALKAAKTNGPSLDSDCGISSAAYSIAAPLKTTGFWCVDSGGNARGTPTSSPTTNYTAISGSATAAHLTSGSTYCN